jgi:hypothetical protein
MRHKLGLRAGDKVELVVSPANGNTHTRNASTEMSRAKQQRMNELLIQNREVNLSSKEKRELEALVMEAQLLTIEKAKRILKKAIKQ